MIAFVTTYYNPLGYSRPLENLVRFVRHMKGVHSVDVHVAQAVYEGTGIPDGSMPPIVTTVRATDDNRLWQKEPLFNRTVCGLSPDYDIVALVDADVTFMNESFVDDIERVMQAYPAAHLYRQAHWLDHRGQIELTRNGSGVMQTPCPHKSHPGFGVVMRRDVFDAIGGLYCSPSADGDVIAVGAFLSRISTRVARHNAVWRDDITQWHGNVTKVCRGKYGYVPGDAFHHKHGEHHNRNYGNLIDGLSSLGFAPDRDVRIDESSGLIEWTAAATTAMRNLLADNFTARKDDSG